jgi:long-chain acyl-CoA synthetase
MTGFYHRFSETVDRLPDRTAVEVQARDSLESFTYGQLRSMAENTSSFLASRGVGAGDRCAILADNDAHWCAAYLGVLRLGAVAVPLDTSYTPAQVARLLSDSGSSLILTSQRFLEAVEEARKELNGACPAYVFGSGNELAGPDAEAARPPASCGPDEPAVILYTSGTTSDPKGVVLTHGNLLGEVDAARSVVDVNEKDAILGVLPLFHALAQMANLLIPFAIGARVVFLGTLNTGELLRALHEREISVFCCVPQFFYLIHQRVLEQIAKAGWPRRLAFRTLLGISGTLRERLGVNLGPTLFSRVHRALGKRMRLLVTGGSRFDPDIGRDLYRLGFNIIQAYGLTETSGAATVLRPGDRHVVSVGHPLPGVQVKIVPWKPEEDAGAGGTLEDERVGEIAIRGPVVSPGYYRRPDVNAAAYRDGWFHSGDLGYLDGDGRLYVTGRAKEMIALGSGKNIYPEEIEAHYLQSPYIAELCVMGRARPDAPAAERLHAVIVPDFDVLRERKILNSQEVLRFDIEDLSTQLPGHKRILSYDIVTDPLPRTTTRKLKRFEIERQLHEAPGRRDAAAEEAPEPTGEIDAGLGPHASLALQIIRGAARDAGAVRPAANLELDLGLDSMERVELLAALEARLGVSVPDEVAHQIHTVEELVEAVRPGGVVSSGGSADDFDPWRHMLTDPSEDDPGVAEILKPRRILAPLLYVGAKIVYAVSWLLLGLRVSGHEHVPRKGPLVISPNHQSFLDAFLLVSTMPYRAFADAFYVGESAYFAGRIRSRLARWLHIVPVDPDSNLVRAMRAGALGLRNGKILILFPEGERTIDGEVKRFKKGAAILSLNVGTPIVPVAIDGAHEIWPRARPPRLSRLLPWSGTRLKIHYGPPLSPTEKERFTEDDYTSLTRRLRESVIALMGQKQKGRSRRNAPSRL